MSDETVRSLSKTLASLPPKRASVLPQIQEQLGASNACTVVLDDDPTGTQTVSEIAVLTTWDTDALADELSRDASLFYVLTNSRALPRDDAISLAKTIGQNLFDASNRTGRPIRVVSRSDSTLRGHFPAEVDSVADQIGQSDAVRVLCPFFIEGGRYTIGDVHYAADGDQLIPCAMTPFAADAAFGYKNSNLLEWTIEKCGDQVSRKQIHSLSLECLRTQPIKQIAKRLAQLPAKSVLIVNAADTTDVECFVAASLIAEAQGQSFLHRTAAGLVRSLAGQSAQPILTRNQIVCESRHAGLIVVGSYVPKTTSQWNTLIQNEPDLVIRIVDLDDALASDSEARAAALGQELSQIIRSGNNVAVCTARELRVALTSSESLEVGRRISRHLVRLVESIDAPLGWLIAKGGITSSDLATEALACRRAEVLGQAAPGIPVWRMDNESRRPGLAYVVFPGNVGSDETLCDVYRGLK